MQQLSRILFFTVTTVLLNACDEQPPATAIYPLVTAVTATVEPHYTTTEQYVGVIKAKHTAQLGFEFAGKVDGINVDIGDRIKQGDPLARLDIQLLANEKLQLDAQQAQVEAQLALIENNLKRQQQLKTKGFSAEIEIDNLTSQRDNLRASRRQIKTAIKLNQLKQEKSTLIAPYSGVISARLVSQGDVISAGTPVVILQSHQQEAYFGLPYQQAIAQPVKTQIRVNQQNYNASLQNQPAQISANTRTITLRYLLESQASAASSPPLLSGQLAHLTLEQQIDTQGAWLPLSALINGPRGVWNAYRLQPIEKQHQPVTTYRIERRSLRVLYANAERAFVDGEIKTGEQFVAAGVHRLVNGQVVQIALGSQ